MINRIFKAIKSPKKGWDFSLLFLTHLIKKRKGTLVIIGLESNGIFSLIHRGYERCYCFEANPDRFNELVKKYKKYSYIHLYNYAVAQYDGEITFNISNNNNGASSSIGEFDEKWDERFRNEKIKMIKTITVPCINLYNFLLKINVRYIDDYVSDIQGMDLEALKTLKPMIDKKKIKTITCEVTKDGKNNIYKNLPSNSETDFKKLLNENYNLISKGWGVLKNGVYENIPEESWEMDCKWTLKQ